MTLHKVSRGHYEVFHPVFGTIGYVMGSGSRWAFKHNLPDAGWSRTYDSRHRAVFQLQESRRRMAAAPEGEV